MHRILLGCASKIQTASREKNTTTDIRTPVLDEKHSGYFIFFFLKWKSLNYFCDSKYDAFVVKEKFSLTIMEEGNI